LIHDLLESVALYVLYRDEADPVKREAWEEARDWLFSDSEDVGSAVYICRAINYSIRKVRLIVPAMSPDDLGRAKKLACNSALGGGAGIK